MNPMTKDEFALRYDSNRISDREFHRLAETAADLTDLLCYGRINTHTPETKRAMAAMIDHWITLGGQRALQDGVGTPLKSESIGNYSYTRAEQAHYLFRGIPISTAALLILDRAGLRNPAVG